MTPTIVAQSKEHLQQLIAQCIAKDGPTCSLNHLDVSNIQDMESLFQGSPFNGDISEWDVAKVKNMCARLYESHFNCDISSWDVSSATNMGDMFGQGAFNGDISQWDISKVESTTRMFERSQRTVCGRNVQGFAFFGGCVRMAVR